MGRVQPEVDRLMMTYGLVLAASRSRHHVSVSTLTAHSLPSARARAKQRLVARQLTSPEGALWDLWYLIPIEHSPDTTHAIAWGTATRILRST